MVVWWGRRQFLRASLVLLIKGPSTTPLYRRWSVRRHLSVALMRVDARLVVITVIIVFAIMLIIIIRQWKKMSSERPQRGETFPPFSVPKRRVL